MTDTNEKKGDLHARAIDLYTPPFRFEYGYIWDAKDQMVADNSVPEDAEGAALRVRGWGRISYLEEPEALQDEVGNIIASAMTEHWNRNNAEPTPDNSDREMLKRLAVILSGSDAPGEIRSLTVTAQSFVDRCKTLAKERELDTEFPTVLPCPVFLEPGLRFGKGVLTSTMLGALQRRAEYYAELEAMTPEEREKHDASIEEFKAMLPQGGMPLHAVPQHELKDHQIRELVNELRDIAIEYHGAQQLRERIARAVRTALNPQQ